MIYQISVIPYFTCATAYPSASEFPLRYQLLAQLLVVVEFLGHLLNRKSGVVPIRLAVFDKHTECFVDATLHSFPIFFESLRITEILLILSAIYRVVARVIATD